MPGARNKKEVVKALTDAFADTKPPEADKIVYSEGLGYYDVLDLRDRLAGVEWQQICRDSNSIEKHRNDEFSFLNISAMRYYLPGYLVACLEDPYGADVLLDRVTDLVLQHTKYGAKDTVKKPDIEEIISSMTTGQIQAIAAFVEFEVTSFPEYSENVSEILEYWDKATRVR